MGIEEKKSYIILISKKFYFPTVSVIYFDYKAQNCVFFNRKLLVSREKQLPDFHIYSHRIYEHKT